MTEKEIDILITERALTCKEAHADALHRYLEFNILDDLRKTMEFDLKMNESRIQYYKQRIKKLGNEKH